jgi:hypothetical protein
LNVAAFCLASLAGSLVARGSAYPGRFSIHVIPVAVAVAACAASLGVPHAVARFPRLGAARRLRIPADTARRS